MQILTGFPEERISKLNKIKNQFRRFTDQIDGDCVALVIEGEGFKSNLTTAIELGIPIVVIAGLKSTGQEYIQEAQEYGVSDRCIVFKDQDNVISADEYIYGQSKKGITIQTITEIASYVLENRLYPEMFIWQEPSQSEKVLWNEPQTPTKTAKPQSSTEQKSKKQIISKDLSAFLSRAKVLAVLKSVPTINSGTIAKTLAERLNGIHLEINNTPRSFEQYASSKENAMQDSYAFSNGETVAYGVYDFKWIVVEINPSMMEVMGTVYEQATKTIYVVENFDESEAALDMWIDGGYKLDAIIPDPINIAPYKEKYGDKVMEIDRFAKQIERR